MCDEHLELVDPTEGLAEAYVDYVKDFLAAGEEVSRDNTDAMTDPCATIRRFHSYAEGLGLPEGYVASSIHFLVRDGTTIVATSGFRFTLTEHLLREGGHIGYSVRPSERGKGYGKLALKLTLDKARQRGLTRVLVTCNKDNAASAKIIQANGGVLENEVVINETGRIKQRYWININPL
ncbi:MAG: GNAT family N-acetyltransferase [Planctomycetota bacterium]